MKRFHLYTVSAAMLFLSACSSDNDDMPGGDVPSATLRIEVSAGDFTNVGGTATRATDSGNTTTFENNDRIGIIALDKNGNVLSDNIPYKYNISDGTWSFDGSSEEKTSLSYNNRAVTYLAYFPYSPAVDGVNSIAALKAEFPPQLDQRTIAAYRASDLLVWSNTTTGSPLKKLEIGFKHAYASLLLSPTIKCTINGTEETYATSVSDVSFSINGEPCLPYKVEDGNYRIITATASANVNVRWHCTYRAVTYGGTMSEENALAENYRYTLAPVVKDFGNYTFDKAQMGDFYCKTTDGKSGYLIPGKIVPFPAVHKDNCIGIVYWVGDITGEDPLLQAEHPQCTHGLVVALQNASDGTPWSNNYEDITNEWLSKQTNTTYKIITLKETEKMQGYANTKALEGYNKSDRATGVNSGKKVLPIESISTYASKHSAPASSSGWYWPSVRELKYMCWGQNNSSGTAGKDALNDQLSKIPDATSLPRGYCWSSTEYSDNAAWFVNFVYGRTEGSGSKDAGSFRVRAVLAF